MVNARSDAATQRGSGIQIFVVILALRRELHVLIPALRIFEDLAFVIPNYDFLVVVIQDVAGIDRDFSAATRRVDDELRNTVAGGMTAQSLDDFNAFSDGCPQMG